ncbi:hypothetical protein CPS_4354 [Colwellia psychrerythraea 34H]|uniref:Uncharacterized protein n=1 Tax=Colwellia psychrerythraea (strain 34H / ATCC BAA-681) TaxID=167879 RepID=Q47W19_COLP3|nr:hypothetical protein CPS_4354 [Colwellia psychrerythraea 34H]
MVTANLSRVSYSEQGQMEFFSFARFNLRILICC